MLGAIIFAGSSNSSTVNFGTGLGGWSTIPVAGISAQFRVIERIRRSSAAETVIVHRSNERGFEFQPAGNSAPELPSAEEQLARYEQQGCDAVLIASAEVYSECDLAVLLGSHRAHGGPVTRACDKDGTLDLWMVDPSRFLERKEIVSALQNTRAEAFEVQGYVNRLQTAGDVRRLAADILSSRCQARPAASEVRPGVWIAEGAQVARSARVVAPAFVGRGVRIAEDCLVTRCSNVESNSYVDFGTAVEDSSILPNTYIGIGLDLSHSIVDGGQIMNLRHNVKLQITDPVVMRRNPSRTQVRNLQPEFELNAVAVSSGVRQ